MKNRRQFVIDSIAAWFLAPELAQRIEWLAQNKEQPYLQNIKNPDVKIFAQWDYGYYHLTYGEDRDGDILNDLSWGRFCEEYLDINPNDTKSILDWAEDQGLHDPDLFRFHRHLQPVPLCRDRRRAVRGALRPR